MDPKGAGWYGKLCTAVIYLSMFVLMLWPTAPDWFLYADAALCATRGAGLTAAPPPAGPLPPHPTRKPPSREADKATPIALRFIFIVVPFSFV